VSSKKQKIAIFFLNNYCFVRFGIEIHEFAARGPFQEHMGKPGLRSSRGLHTQYRPQQSALSTCFHLTHSILNRESFFLIL
jgi:hypothetical protein